MEAQKSKRKFPHDSSINEPKSIQIELSFKIESIESINRNQPNNLKWKTKVINKAKYWQQSTKAERKDLYENGKMAMETHSYCPFFGKKLCGLFCD